MVRLVAWFTLVLEAKCIRQPVSLLFPPLFFFILKRGRNKKELSPCLNEFRCYEAKIEESEKGWQPPGVEPRTPLA